MVPMLSQRSHFPPFGKYEAFQVVWRRTGHHENPHGGQWAVTLDSSWALACLGFAKDLPKARCWDILFIFISIWIDGSVKENPQSMDSLYLTDSYYPAGMDGQALWTGYLLRFGSIIPVRIIEMNRSKDVAESRVLTNGEAALFWTSCQSAMKNKPCPMNYLINALFKIKVFFSKLFNTFLKYNFSPL